MQNLRCPLDDTLLEHKKNSRGMYWECPKCAGRSIAMMVLKKVVDKQTVQSLWQLVYQGKGDESHGCVHCQGPMQYISRKYKGQELEIDACRACQFFWFQPHQLSSVPVTPEPPPTPEQSLSLEAKLLLAEAQRQQDDQRLRQYESKSIVKTLAEEGLETACEEGLGMVFDAVFGL